MRSGTGELTEEKWYEDRDLALIDGKTSPDELLHHLDEMLAKFGLEVVIWDTSSDTVAFKIEKKEE